MRKCLILLLLVTGCASQHISEPETLKEYVSDNKLGWNLDGTHIYDKNFKLQIPPGLKSRADRSSSAFLHELNYDDKSQIVLIYIPNSKTSFDVKLENLNYKEFESFCNTSQIYDVEEWHVSKNGRFGIRNAGQAGCYALYLNVKPKRVKTFNLSIESAIYN